MSDKKIRKFFVNRAVPLEVAELIDEIHCDKDLNMENVSKSGLVGKALLDYKNKRLCQINEYNKTKALSQDPISLESEFTKLPECSESAELTDSKNTPAY